MSGRTPPPWPSNEPNESPHPGDGTPPHGSQPPSGPPVDPAGHWPGHQPWEGPHPPASTGPSYWQARPQPPNQPWTLASTPPWQQPPVDPYREQRAQEAAARAYAKASRPWYRWKRTWFVVLPLVLIWMFGLNGRPDESGDTVAAIASPSATRTVEVGGVASADEAGSPSPSPEAPSSPPVPPEILTVTADQLLDALDENALKASHDYLDKRIRIEGRLSNIDASGEYFTLDRKKGRFSFADIHMSIEPEHRDAVMKFTADQIVVATGTITDVGEVLGYRVRVETIG